MCLNSWSRLRQRHSMVHNMVHYCCTDIIRSICSSSSLSTFSSASGLPLPLYLWLGLRLFLCLLLLLCGFPLSSSPSPSSSPSLSLSLFFWLLPFWLVSWTYLLPFYSAWTWLVCLQLSNRRCGHLTVSGFEVSSWYTNVSNE